MARQVDAERHEAVILQAFEALRRRGVVGVSMADIAADLGIKRSALYWYFRGLPELFEHVLEIVLGRQGEAVAAAVAEASHPVDALAAWMRATARFYRDDPDLLAVLLQLWATARPDSKDETIAAFRVRFAPLFEGAIAELRGGVEAGHVAACDPAAIVDLCAAALDGALVHGLVRGIDAPALVEAFVATVLEPLRREPTATARTIPRRSVEKKAGAAGATTSEARLRGGDDWMSWD